MPIFVWFFPLIWLAAGIGFASDGAAEGAPFAEVDSSFQESMETGSFADHLSRLDALSAGHGESYEFLWRAARGYWAAGDFLYWQYTLDNLRAAQPKELDDAFDAEKDLSEPQGEELINLGKKGRTFAKKASEINPAAIQGHFYHAASISIYALGKSIIAALGEGLKGEFDDGVDAAMRIDRTFLEGAPLRFNGRAYFKLPWPLRDYEESHTLLLESAAIGPEVPVTYLFLGDTQWKLEDKAEAVQSWGKAARFAAQRTHEAVNRYIAGNAKLKIALAASELS